MATKIFIVSLEVCSHDPILSDPIALDLIVGSCRMEIEQVLFPSNFLNCRMQLLGGCFKRVHMIRQLDPTQSDPTKLDRVNRPLDSQS